MKVKFSKKFEKQYSKFSEKIKKAFGRRLDLFVANPNHPLLRNHALIGELQGLRSINITGDIRALYQETEKDRVIFISIGSHSQLYEN